MPELQNNKATGKVEVTAYMHENKGQLIEQLKDSKIIKSENDLNEVARDNLYWGLYEIELQLEVDLDTGDYKILSVNG